MKCYEEYRTIAVIFGNNWNDKGKGSLLAVYLLIYWTYGKSNLALPIWILLYHQSAIAYDKFTKIFLIRIKYK